MLKEGLICQVLEVQVDIEAAPVTDRVVWAEVLWDPVVLIMVTDICRHRITDLTEVVDAADV